MAYNTDSGWLLRQMMFQRATDSEDVKEQLIKCLEMLKASHDVRVLMVVKSVKSEYSFRAFVKDKKYYLEVKRILYMYDGLEFIPSEQTYEYLSSDVNSKKKYKTLDERYSIGFASNQWRIEYLDNSDTHEKGAVINIPRTHSDEPTETDTFTPEGS